MSGQIIQLYQVLDITVLPPGATLADFIAACQAVSAEKVKFYVLTGPAESAKDHPKIKNLSVYSRAVGLDQRNQTLVEQPPLYLGKIAYEINDEGFERPLGFTRIDPAEDLKRYSQENAIYLAQQGFETTSFLRFKSPTLEEICRIRPEEAKRYSLKTEPVVIYL